LSPESTPEDWLRAIEDCASSVSITTVVGSPHSGKSTFSRRLVNRHLTGQGKSAKPASAVCYLDLDHSKPEYTPHGQISLVTVKDLNLGPSFTHPSTLPGSQGPETIRAHAIPSHLANYKEYYRSCAEDLFLTYKSLQSRSSAPLPLIINTPAHLYTSDFDILIDLLARCKPHHIIHLSDTAAIDSETATKPHTLQTTSAHYRSTVHELTAQFPTTTPLRSEAELRAMHMQSYFHLKSRQVTYSPTVAMTTWNSQPVSHLAPWEFQYRETPSRTQDFAGFISYAEPVEPSSLFDALNGSVVQIIESTSSAIPSPYTALPRTSKHQIPYFAKDERTGMVEPLNPKTTRFVCTALVRGFDVQRGVVQVLVPRTHEEVLYNVVPERTVMVGGCCEMPEWAYVEDAYAAVGQIPGGRKDAPWVEEKSIMEEMGYLNTVRRVRKFQS
jgi:polynucleotide 5'-hydroxyl-kinase GRC3/NOL9